MRKAIALVAVVLVALAASSAVGVVRAHASDCKSTTFKALRSCVNTRLDNQFKLEQKIQAQIASGPTTSAAVAAAIAQLQNDVSNVSNEADNTQQRISCWGNDLNLSQYSTSGGPFGSTKAPAGGFPYVNTSSDTYTDISSPGDPGNQTVWRVIVNEC
jgi:hypothetical protein